ncbi:hypothetical protein [Comamonas thiooxydans]|uniref:hypothetical protein n=1 Tax=Comamonas thiooxydans TaxID=363952 RepID=UPI00057B0EDA|nr:hypothetical protein [Comamonas thiooxydans]
MKAPQNEESESEAVATVVCGVVVGSIFLLVITTALAGWSWVENFLVSSAPAWIQAVGSVAAIFAALGVVHRQHRLELRRRQTEDHTVLIRRARTLRVIFMSAARVCEEVARKIGQPHVIWRFKADELREVRSRLLAIDPLLVPNGSLLLIIEECARRLQSCALLVAEMETPRDKEAEDAIKAAVMRTARECWLGLYEATGLEVRLCKSGGANESPYSFDNFVESRMKLDEIRAEFQSEAGHASPVRAGDA